MRRRNGWGDTASAVSSGAPAGSSRCATGGALGMGGLAALCRHFDPQRIMNPGKLLADGPPGVERWSQPTST